MSGSLDGPVCEHGWNYFNPESCPKCQPTQDEIMSSYFYLATPYSKYPLGINRAYEDACRVSAWFLDLEIPIFCPIVHTHPIARYTIANPLDGKFWAKMDQPLMNGAKEGLIVMKLPSWEESVGVKAEADWFAKVGRRIFYLEPEYAAVLNLKKSLEK